MALFCLHIQLCKTAHTQKVRSSGYFSTLLLSFVCWQSFCLDNLEMQFVKSWGGGGYRWQVLPQCLPSESYSYEIATSLNVRFTCCRIGKSYFIGMLTYTGGQCSLLHTKARASRCLRMYWKKAVLHWIWPLPTERVMRNTKIAH